MNPFQPNPFQPNIQLILTPEEEQFVLGQGGVNSGIENINQYNPILKKDERIQRHNLNAQRTYRNRYREDYNENMRKLFANKYGKDAPDSEAKRQRNEKMKLINQNYRNRQIVNGSITQRSMKKALERLFVDAKKNDVVDGIPLNEVFKSSGAVKKKISQIYKDKGITLQQFKKELKDKWESENKDKAVDNIKATAKAELNEARRLYKNKYGVELTDKDVYEKEEVEDGEKTGRIGKRKNYEYTQVDYDGLELYNPDEGRKPYMKNRFKPRASAPTNSLVLSDYYNNVITNIQNPILEKHRKIENGVPTKTDYKTHYGPDPNQKNPKLIAGKRAEHRKLLKAKEWGASENANVFTPTI